MAASTHISTKMVLEYVDSVTDKTTRFTFPYVKSTITDNQLFLLAGRLNSLQNKAYTNLLKTVESEIY